MKVFNVIFGVCLGALALYGVAAMAADDMARAAMRGITSNSTSGNTRAGAKAGTTTRPAPQREDARNTAAPSKTVAARTTSKSRTTTTQTGGARTTQNTGHVVSRKASTTAARTVATRPAARNATRRPAATTRGALTTAAKRKPRSAVRAATTESGVRTTEYQKCREIYYDCMDEFCANKDSSLRRCACSARASEFDSVKQQMSRVEDKMLDFNQRLLMVNMDAKDVEAINTASIGENAYYESRDKTKSQQALNEISKKLNKTFGEDASGNTALAPISMSLNAESAFDSVDALLGANTTTKTGAALYNAALPICREMAAEVCTDDEFALATSGYQMQIEQDCNTVFKAYQSQVDQARTKVFESGALLDISRLDAYQSRNSDDILTCKKKMLDLLTDTGVCGQNMERCLDLTGRYIDPSTGKAFLTISLADLDTLIARPDSGQTWTSVNAGSAFLTYLNGKKTYLESATKNCQDVADQVWSGFIEDALAQIKLAQGAKLQEIRESCTTLTTECMINASESITEFDARALSTFGIAATRTAVTMCTDVQNACGALLAADGGESWATGMRDTNTLKSYESILSSCNLVGQECIIQACRSTAGNFGLCNDITLSPNRHAILERTSCWQEVMDCVASAGDTTIERAMTLLGKTSVGAPYKFSFYDDLYDTSDPFIIDDLCDNECGINSDDLSCAKCRITERIWGNCEQEPSLTTNGGNRIKATKSTSTLLTWFAKNTGTADNPKSCVNVRCTNGDQYITANGQRVCLESGEIGDVTGDGRYCPTGNGNIQMTIRSGLTNCCFNNTTDTYINLSSNAGICCENGQATTLGGTQICLPSASYTPVLRNNSGDVLICVGASSVSGDQSSATNDYPNGTRVVCNGRLVKISNNYTSYETVTGAPTSNLTPQTYYRQFDSDTHTAEVKDDLSPQSSYRFIGYSPIPTDY